MIYNPKKCPCCHCKLQIEDIEFVSEGEEILTKCKSCGHQVKVKQEIVEVMQ